MSAVCGSFSSSSSLFTTCTAVHWLHDCGESGSEVLRWRYLKPVTSALDGSFHVRVAESVVVVALSPWGLGSGPVGTFGVPDVVATVL